MSNYDATRFDPPAPVANVRLSAPENALASVDVELLIDSGADITLLPRTAVEGLGVAALPDRYEVMGFDGTCSLVPAAIIDMHFLGRQIRGRYLLMDRAIGVLGRDVINHFALILNGVQQQWSEHSA